MVLGGRVAKVRAIVESTYGRDGEDAEERVDGDEGSHEGVGGGLRDDDDEEEVYDDDASVGAPVVHWGTSPNRPEDNAPGDPNAFWFSFSPELVSMAGEGSIGKGSAVGVVDGDLAVGAVAVVVVPLAAWCALRRR